MVNKTPMLLVAVGAVYYSTSRRLVTSLQSSFYAPHHISIRSMHVPSHLHLSNTDPFLKFTDELKEQESALLDELREEIGDMRQDLVEPPVMFATEDEATQSFDLSRWETHRSASRYFRLMPGVLFSVTTRRISITVGSLVFWSAAVQAYHSYAISSAPNLPEFQLPIVPFELTAPVLGLLLVFRSNTAFDRFNLGSEASWAITNHCKTISRELLAFTAKNDIFAQEERLAAYDLVEACQVLHGLLMKRYLRGKQMVVSPRQGEKFFQKALGVAAPDLSANLPIAPAAAIAAISLGISRRLPSLDFQESTLIEEQLSDLQMSLGTCEKLLRTPIPLGYTRYSVRFLWAWLYLLPFALVDTFYKFGLDTWWEDKPQPVLAFATLFICFIFVSIEDIAVQIEEPFSILPLELHQKWLERDVTQMITMNRAMDEQSFEVEKDDEIGINGSRRKTTRRLGWRNDRL